MNENPQKPKEPEVTFLTFLSELDEGRFAYDLTEHLEGLVAECRALSQIQGTKPRGTLTITISLEGLPGGKLLSVAGTTKVKKPTRPRAPATFWPTKHNGLSAQNPDQLKIPGIDVTGAGGRAIHVV